VQVKTIDSFANWAMASWVLHIMLPAAAVLAAAVPAAAVMLLTQAFWKEKLDIEILGIHKPNEA